VYQYFEQKVGEIMYYYDKNTNSWYHLTEGNTTTYVKDENILTILFKHMIDTVEAKLIQDVKAMAMDWTNGVSNCATTFELDGKNYEYYKLLDYFVKNVILTTLKIGKPPKPEDYGYNNGGLYEEAGWEIEGGEEAYGKAIAEWEKANMSATAKDTGDLDIDKPHFG
jgi:hypothetical protein